MSLVTFVKINPLQLKIYEDISYILSYFFQAYNYS